MAPDNTFFKSSALSLVAVIFAMLLVGCGAPAWKKPVPVDQVDFKSRMETESRNGLTVSVAVPSREETELLFGTSLYADGIQPVWVEIDNQTDRAYLLLKVGMDLHPFSPLEASYQRHSGSKEERREMDLFFYRMDFKNPALPGQSKSGFVFTNLDEGHKAINIDLISNSELQAFSFVVEVPGLVTDASQVNVDEIYNEWIELQTISELRDVLESFPCCTTNEAGDKNGDPLNIVLIGKRSDIFSALIRRGWHQTEITRGESIKKTVKSFLFGTKYRYSPISPLYVFGRDQDIGLQKARESISLRNHMRLWRTPYNFQGKEVIIGQISRDIGVKFNKRTITTHAIDPDVDSTRNALAADLAYSQALVKIAFVKGSQVSTLENPHYNLSPDLYISDGNRVVMFFDERPTTLAGIELLNWGETPFAGALVD